MAEESQSILAAATDGMLFMLVALFLHFESTQDFEFLFGYLG